MANTKKVKPIPEGYHTVTPYLIFKNTSDALDFYRTAFGAKELVRFEDKGRIMHAEIQIGDSRIMMGDEAPHMGIRSAQTVGACPIGLMVYVENVDSFYNKAIQAGAKQTRPVQDQFYGDRSGTLEDPFGYTWTIGTHKEDVSMEEMRERMQAATPVS